MCYLLHVNRNAFIDSLNQNAIEFPYIPGDPRKCDELDFLITSKVIQIEPSYWMEKKQNFMKKIPISMI